LVSCEGQVYVVVLRCSIKQDGTTRVSFALPKKNEGSALTALSEIIRLLSVMAQHVGAVVNVVISLQSVN
jgi:hypothetical protein